MTASVVPLNTSPEDNTGRIRSDIREAEDAASELTARLAAITRALADLTSQVDARQARRDRRSQSMMLTPEEAADSLRVSRTVVFSLIKCGKLESVKIGKCRRVPAAALATYIATLHS